MKQNEHYNQNSAPQLNSVLKSFPYIQRGVLECQAVIAADLPTSFTIVDYGCSQGANSVVAIEEILSNLRKKYSTTPSLNFLVVFNDQSTNDWTTLFKTVEKHFLKDEHVTTLASGNSFYEQIMPSNSVHFAYTSTSINWISKKPCNITNQCCISAVEVRQEEFQLWKQQAYNDYKLFLQNRSKELKKGELDVTASS
jgi:CRISPR/Cas system CMR subunit Cmr4 (Cas7 group RAMP superfamily)